MFCRKNNSKKRSRKLSRKTKTMRGGQLKPLENGQIIRRIDRMYYFSGISDLVPAINNGPITDIESKLLALEAKHRSLEARIATLELGHESNNDDPHPL